MKLLNIFILLALFPCVSSGAEKSDNKKEVIDYVAAVVNTKPVTYSDVQTRLEIMKKSKAQIKNLNNSKVLDVLINEKIIEQEAETQAIQVTDTRIDNEIAEMMKRSKISDLKTFSAKIQAEQGLSYEMLRMQIRQQNLTEQVMMYSLSVAPPSKKEIREWYDKNKSRGEMIQMNLKHILVIPRSSSYMDEKAANDKMNSILQKIRGGASFEEVARQDSQDAESAKNGGDLGWSNLADLDPYFAGVAMQSYRQGGLSPVFKSSFGYHIIKFMGKRIVPFEEIQPRIANLLGYQRRSEEFNKWLNTKKQVSEISIYMEGYVRTKGNNEKGVSSSR